jgi:hypothetical protein
MPPARTVSLQSERALRGGSVKGGVLTCANPEARRTRNHRSMMGPYSLPSPPVPLVCSLRRVPHGHGRATYARLHAQEHADHDEYADGHDGAAEGCAGHFKAFDGGQHRDSRSDDTVRHEQAATNNGRNGKRLRRGR